MGALDNVFEEFRIVILYSLLGTILTLLVILLDWDYNTISPLIKVVLCLYITISEDHIAVDLPLLDLMIRFGLNSASYFLIGYVCAGLKDNFPNKSPPVFSSSDPWSIWLAGAAIEYLKVANTVTWYRTCVFSTILIIYGIVYLVTSFDTSTTEK